MSDFEMLGVLFRLLLVLILWMNSLEIMFASLENCWEDLGRGIYMVINLVVSGFSRRENELTFSHDICIDRATEHSHA